MTKKRNPVNPAAAVPQAPRVLRAGTKGHARAKAAEMSGGPPPEPKDDDDEDEEEDEEEEDALVTHEPLRADAEAKHRAAADAYASAKGTDSAAALMAAEDAGDAAVEAHTAAKGSSMKLRGAEDPDPDSRPAPQPPAPAPGAAQALSALGGTSASSQLEIAALAAGMRDVMKATGAANVGAALLQVQAGVVALGEVRKIRAAEKANAAKTDIEKRSRRLAAAVQAGFERSKAFQIKADGTPGDPLPVWMNGTLEQLDSTLATLGYPAGAPSKVAALITADGGDEAGLAARAAASGMDIETRRAAEANQRRSRAQETAR